MAHHKSLRENLQLSGGQDHPFWVSLVDFAAATPAPRTALITYAKHIRKTSCAQPPVIILGMHRSGTSLLSRLLELLGLFLGKKKDENNEAILFQRTNEWLLRQAGGTWDNPAPIQYLLGNTDVREKTTNYVRDFLLTSRSAASYAGWFEYLRHRRLDPLSKPWGWKDPRNTFTLPIWLDIFPNAKIIHLHRAGMDVALSLQRRGRRQLQLQRFYRSTPFLHWMRPKRGGFVHSLRCDHLDAGLALWSEYLEQGCRHAARAEKPRIRDKFRNACARACPESYSAVAFCDLRADSIAIERASRLIRPGALTPAPDFQRFEEPLHSS